MPRALPHLPTDDSENEARLELVPELDEASDGDDDGADGKVVADAEEADEDLEEEKASEP